MRLELFFDWMSPRGHRKYAQCNSFSSVNLRETALRLTISGLRIALELAIAVGVEFPIEENPDRDIGD